MLVDLRGILQLQSALTLLLTQLLAGINGYRLLRRSLERGVGENW